MPCPICDETRIYDTNSEYLYCPTGCGIPTVPRDDITNITDELDDRYLALTGTDELLEKYGAPVVIRELARQGNNAAFGLSTRNRMEYSEFIYSAVLIREIYKQDTVFTGEPVTPPEDSEELHDRVSTVLNEGVTVIAAIEQLSEDFLIPVLTSPQNNGIISLFANTRFEKSEYWFCMNRCLQNTFGGWDENRSDFLESRAATRTFERTDADDIGTPYEYGDAWFGLITSLGFATSLSSTSQDLFSTDFPDSITIFQLRELFDRIEQESEIQKQLKAGGKTNLHPAEMREDTFDTCGEDVFGSNWPVVKDSILMSPDTPEAHPLFFKLTGARETRLQPGRPPRTVPDTRVLYPDQSAFILQFQIFPLLHNRRSESGERLLDQINGNERAPAFEQKIHDYLNRTGIQSYHSCTLPGSNDREIDVIFVRDGVVYFTEVKFILPELELQTQNGMQNINDEYDEKIFNYGSDNGLSYPEKVSDWQSLEPGDRFHHSGQEPYTEIPDEWGEYDIELLVVSNFTPSYIKKNGVRFITDLELRQWIENDRGVFYSKHHFDFDHR